MNKQSEQQATLHKQLWAMANELRGNMDASEFKNYILTIIFYRYLSENIEKIVSDFLKEDHMTYEQAWEIPEYRKALIDDLTNSSDIGYLIEPEYLYASLVKKIKTNSFDIAMLSKAINKLSESTLGQSSQEDFENLFDDLDLNSSRLGRGETERSLLMGKIILKVNEIDFMHGDSEIDVLGDAYEYLIGKFAANAGKKAGEYYTPQAVSELLARIVTLGKKEIKSVYDPTCGSGSLLLRISKHAKVVKYYGQEKTPTTYNLARMNMMLHKVTFDRFNIYQEDTLERPCPAHEGLKFEAVVANPPYSAKWSADAKFENDDRFSGYGKLAPKSKADYAFVQHMIHHLDDDGTMAVVLPHGVLFRGGAEAAIRKYLIDNKNYLDAVIGLPANIFFGTSIPTTVLVFKKCRENKDILFIDASKYFKKEKNQNVLLPEHIDKIVDTYKERKTIDKYAFVANLKDIEENDYNLNIPRYVDTFEEEEPVDLDEVRKQLKAVDQEIEDITKEINKYLDELGEPRL